MAGMVPAARQRPVSTPTVTSMPRMRRMGLMPCQHMAAISWTLLPVRHAYPQNSARPTISAQIVGTPNATHATSTATNSPSMSGSSTPVTPCQQTTTKRRPLSHNRVPCRALPPPVQIRGDTERRARGRLARLTEKRCPCGTRILRFRVSGVHVCHLLSQATPLLHAPAPRQRGLRAHRQRRCGRQGKTPRVLTRRQGARPRARAPHRAGTAHR